MAKVDLDRFVELIRLSRVVDDSDLDQALDSLESDVRDNPERTAEALIQRGLLTRWQADNILDGKHKGFRLGNYRLKSKLGRGGMSTVYLAEHALMRREAAIKVLPRKRVSDSSYLARFHREAQAAAALDHPNIVRIYDVDSDGDVHFIAMEFIDGQDLQSRISAEGRLDFEKAADFIAQSALGLQHAHDVGLIHRDIKPANLLANSKGIIKILDMGLAKFDGDDESASLTVEHDENVLGTVDYLAPEQAIDSHNVDHRADIYSLGCTLYFLLTGHAPFPEGSLAQRLMKHQKAKPAPILEKRPDTPPELLAICSRMMEKKPEKRTASATIVAEQLGGFLAARGRTVTGDSGAGSSIGLAAAAMREFESAQLQEDGEEPNAFGAAGTTEAERDTTISRSQNETTKSAPSLIPDELELVQPAPDDKSPGGAATPRTEKKLSPEEQRRHAVAEKKRLASLAKELAPIHSVEDNLMSGSVRVERRIVRSDPEGEGIPFWVWIVAGCAILLIVILIAFFVF